jgi:GH24 family phage-related lysozyme (muramidase)
MAGRKRSQSPALKELQRVTRLLDEEVIPALRDERLPDHHWPGIPGPPGEDDGAVPPGARRALQGLYGMLTPRSAAALGDLFSSIDGDAGAEPEPDAPESPESAPPKSAAMRATAFAGRASARARWRPRRLSKRGAKLIAQFEGLRRRLYNDPAGHCTIGIGHLVHRGRCNGREPAQFKRGITSDRAYALLQQDARRMEKAVNGLRVPLNQNQFDALVSFTYNLGPGWTVENNNLRKLLRARRYRAVPRELNTWVHAGGQVLPGLVRRRKAEGRLFLAPVGPPPKPGPVKVADVQRGKNNRSVLVVQRALARAVGLDYSSGPGHFGPRTTRAYAAWQRRCRIPASGRPEHKSLKMLGDKHGFKVQSAPAPARRPRREPARVSERVPSGSSAQRVDRVGAHPIG